MTMVENPTWTLAERMVRSRLLAGVDQAVIAERLGVARTTVSAWETGRTEPSATNFVLWAEITGQPIEWLAEGVMCARRDSNPQPSDLYLDDESDECCWGCDPCDGGEATCCYHKARDDAFEVEHQLLLLVEAVTL